MNMVTLVLPDGKRMGMDTASIVRTLEVDIPIDVQGGGGCIPGLEITFYTGAQFTLRDSDRTLFDFIQQSRGENWDRDATTLVLK